MIAVDLQLLDIFSKLLKLTHDLRVDLVSLGSLVQDQDQVGEEHKEVVKCIH